MSEPFYAQSRFKSLKALIGKTETFVHGGAEDEAVISYLEDLVANLATKAGSREDEAFYYMIRCMGAIVEANADDAYEPYGYVNPFRPDGSTREPPPKIWKWPIVNQPPSSGSGGFTGKFRDYSALKMFGYTVGNKGRDDGWSDHRRRMLLSDFMEMSLPVDVKKTFGDEYGEPISTTRLRKVANLIATLANNTARKSNAASYEQAIADWEDDLAYLEDKYYHGKGLKFHPWPEVER